MRVKRSREAEIEVEDNLHRSERRGEAEVWKKEVRDLDNDLEECDLCGNDVPRMLLNGICKTVGKLLQQIFCKVLNMFKYFVLFLTTIMNLSRTNEEGEQVVRGIE